jgi:hypothetical protein
MFKIGRRPMKAFVDAHYYIDNPDGGPEYGLRAGLTMLFPK